MTKEEAHIYLPLNEEDDLQDIYEEKLFELKQFFLNRFPVSKLIESRLSKFRKVERAFELLGGERTAYLKKEEQPVFPVFDSLHELYVWYNKEKNSLKLELTASESHEWVSEVLNKYIRLTRFYAKHWEVPEKELNDTTIKVGVEPNPMDIQQALNDLTEQGKLDSNFILSLPDDNYLKSEAKRLSLWLNFEINEQSI